MSLWFGAVCWKRRRSTQSCGGVWAEPAPSDWVCLIHHSWTTWSSTTKRTTSTTRDCSVSSASVPGEKRMCAPLGAYVTLAPIMQLEGGGIINNKCWKNNGLTDLPTCMHVDIKVHFITLTTPKTWWRLVHVQDCKTSTAEDELDQSEHLSSFAFNHFCVFYSSQIGSVCVCAWVYALRRVNSSH